MASAVNRIVSLLPLVSVKPKEAERSHLGGGGTAAGGLATWPEIPSVSAKKTAVAMAAARTVEECVGMVLLFRSLFALGAQRPQKAFVQMRRGALAHRGTLSMVFVRAGIPLVSTG